MAARAFFYYDTTLEKWKAGALNSEGDWTSEFTITKGEARDLWRVSSEGVVKLTLRFAGSNNEIPPFEDIPITEVAKNTSGDTYSSKSDFETTVKNFFFRGIDPTDTVLSYSKADVDTLIAKSVFSEVLVSTPILHNGAGTSTKIFETTIDPKLGIDGWMKFAIYASMTGSNAHTFSVRVSNQSIIQLAPTTTPSLKVENLLYNKNNVTKQGAGNLGGGYGTSSSALLNFDGVIDTSAPMLISVWCNATIGDSFTIDRLQLDYRK